MLLDGKVALITGAARGIGFLVATRLASDGARVVLSDVNEDSVRERAEQLRHQGFDAHAIAMDVANENSVETHVAQLERSVGTLNIAVNCAAIWSKLAFEEMPLSEWRRIFAVNVEGTFLLTRAAFKIMKAAGYGRIINIASNSFLTAGPNFAHYNASKGAVIGLTRSVATEGGAYGITANAIAPGLIDTEGVRETFGSSITANVEQRIPRLGQASDIAEAVAFLASPNCGFMTGQTLYINGGTRYS